MWGDVRRGLFFSGLSSAGGGGGSGGSWFFGHVVGLRWFHCKGTGNFENEVFGRVSVRGGGLGSGQSVRQNSL